MIETGGIRKIPRDHTKCQTCYSIDDDIHFFLHCLKLSFQRNYLYNNIHELNDHFRFYSPYHKIRYILNTENFELLSAV